MTYHQRANELRVSLTGRHAGLRRLNTIRHDSEAVERLLPPSWKTVHSSCYRISPESSLGFRFDRRRFSLGEGSAPFDSLCFIGVNVSLLGRKQPFVELNARLPGRLRLHSSEDTAHITIMQQQERQVQLHSHAFPGNSNADTVVQYKLDQPVVARYLRLVPLDWNPTGRIGLRLEAYGCRYTSDVVNFDGSSSLVFRLSARPSRSATETISLKFKTMRNSGTLLHAEGQRDHSLTLVLEKGRLLLYHQQEERRGEEKTREDRRGQETRGEDARGEERRGHKRRRGDRRGQETRGEDKRREERKGHERREEDRKREEGRREDTRGQITKGEERGGQETRGGERRREEMTQEDR
ncbi:unnamed protein product [Pleuronectes platessa]|uniref:F5/8 type C domain-containing protein n=1 Tax=Pleuronectes platessa TaxID=8262 RepID=A0A9N7YDM9_PLEPL|nr:unnamed protein product [Pleuronectes platessa]